MQSVATRILAMTRKRLLGVRALFEPYEPVSLGEIDRIEKITGTPLPPDLTTWLLTAGYGDLDQVLSFRHDWFQTITEGHLTDAVIFAQDDLGNFYAFWPSDGRIYFLNRSAPEYAAAAASFESFMQELERRDFQLEEWMRGLPHLPYRSDA